MYDPLIQDIVAPTEYYRERDNKIAYHWYLNNSRLLPFLNNEKPHSLMDQYKKRFSSMNKVMLIMFGEDEVLYPRETSFFQEHDLDGNIVAYEDTELYKND